MGKAGDWCKGTWVEELDRDKGQVIYNVMTEQSWRRGKGRQLHLKIALFPEKIRATSGRTPTCDIQHTVQMFYQLSHLGSSAGQAESLRFIQVQRRLFSVRHGYSKLST